MANYGIQLKDKAGNNYYPCPFPVGFVVLTTNKVNPQTYWGGTWVQYYGGYIYAAQSSIGQTSYTGWGTQSGGSGTSGGPSTNTSGSTALTIAQMPEHSHNMAQEYSASSGAGYWFAENMAVTLKMPSGGGWRWWTWSQATGGSSGHTHTLSSHTHSTPAHSHNIASVDVFAWKRTA